MWIIHPVFIIISCLFLSVLEATSAANMGAAANSSTTNGNEEALTKVNQPSSRGDTVCADLNPLVYGIISFLAAMVLILLILVFKAFSARHGGITGDTIHMNTERGESLPLSQNNALNVCPPSNNCADDSSSTSSESSEGSVADLCSSSQRYVSPQGRRKTSDYINVSEGTSSGRVDFKTEKTGKGYVNLKEPRKKVTKEGRENCDDGSNASDESVVNYSTVVFTK
ncbi:uncharacterized protein LOC127426393 [Myxocyprinus asiaticus]|uniref:uncharacterized protein LOC127426393 n=1 Tax=Myxocyprinus asiaticus TaxID=70543 RepID=UPI0022235938|nr:uncharacterized protein LOC127426393 [Myxocyprinus asiaticus]